MLRPFATVSRSWNITHDDVPALAHPLTRPDPSPTSLIAVREIQPRISGKPAPL
jgi:hypothetical protein